jgi:two-component system, OmpR family, sensor histidine kinase KdpD
MSAIGSPTPPDRPRSRPWAGWLRAVGVVLVCTGVAELMDTHFEPADQIMVFLAGVVYLALRDGGGPATLGVVLGIGVFDLVFVPPRWGFNPHNPQYFFTFAVMAVVGLLVSRLAAQARLQALVADARARRATALNQLAERLVAARSGAAVAEGLTAAIGATFGVTSVLLLPDAQDRLGAPTPLRVDLPVDLDAAAAVLAGGTVPATAADAPSMLPLRGAGPVLGVLVTGALPARFADAEDRHLLHAFANQAALALERALFEQRSAEAVLAAEGERLRSTLLSGISHDLRTPLTTIVGAATSLVAQGDALGAARRDELLRSVLDQSRRMHAAMSDLLDLTRMEEGAVQPQCEWCPADELVEEARTALGTRLAGRTLRLEVPPAAVVWCDPRLLEQALVNLLDNALRHTPPTATITVQIALAATSWSLVVADDGPGLPAGREREVFKKFFRGRGEAAGLGTGTGLGLAICAAVARLHGGHITAENHGGARFTLTLPQPAAHGPALEEAA